MLLESSFQAGLPMTSGRLSRCPKAAVEPLAINNFCAFRIGIEKVTAAGMSFYPMFDMFLKDRGSMSSFVEKEDLAPPPPSANSSPWCPSAEEFLRDWYQIWSGRTPCSLSNCLDLATVSLVCATCKC